MSSIRITTASALVSPVAAAEVTGAVLPTVGTAAASHADEVREPTAEEIAATSAIQNAADAKATTFQEGAAMAAVKAAKGAATFTYDAVVSLALNLCGEQIRETLTEGAYEPAKDDYAFRRDVLFILAKEGEMIYRDTVDAAANLAKLSAECKAARGKAAKDTANAALRAAAVAYVNTKGAKPVQLVANLRKYGFQLAKLYRENHKDIIVAAAQCGTYAGAAEIFSNHVAANFPQGWNAFSDKLDAIREAGKAPKAAKAGKGAGAADGTGDEVGSTGPASAMQADKVGAIMDSVQALSDAEFLSLMHRMKAEMIARQSKATASEAPAVIALPLQRAA